MVKGRASRVTSLFSTKKKSTEISPREEADSQQMRLKRHGMSRGLAHCVQIQPYLGALIARSKPLEDELLEASILSLSRGSI